MQTCPPLSNPPLPPFFFGHRQKISYFFIIFRYAYQKIQNCLKNKILKREKNKFTQIIMKQTGQNENISLNFSSKYIFFRFRTFCIFFSLKKIPNWLRTGGSRIPIPTPPPTRLHTCLQLLCVFLTPSLFTFF